MTAAALAILLALAPGDDGPTPAQIFEKRILPIFKSPQPSSCIDCHLAGVDLKNYILPSHEKTFLSLRDQGMIDLAKPDDSRILRLIAMGENQGAALINDKVRKAELAAFTEWIKACVADPKLKEAPKLAASELAQPKRPNEVIRHERIDQVLASFERNVWSQRFRCSGCHSPDGAENAKLAKENGDEITWIRREGAEASMKFLISGKLVQPKAPEKSLLLLKPLNVVKHGGGQKLLSGDLTYKGFRTWIEDYAKVMNDQYAKASELPKETAAPLAFGSEIWLKLTNTPPAWGDKLLQVTLYAWDEKKKAWESEPIANSDRKVFGKGKLWQHSLSLLAPAGSPRAEAWGRQAKPTLPAGKYLIRIHVDAQGRLERDWKSPLGKADLVGELEVDSRWPEGYGSMTAVDAGKIK
jgi:mono/diheme cytochrome c family protein